MHSIHKKVWQLAGPIILANITVPLLGAVDLAVVGHLPGPEYMAAVGIGAAIFSALYFGFVFLRMGTTGLVAIARGAKDTNETFAWLFRALLLGLSIGAFLVCFQKPLSAICFYLIHPLGAAKPLAEQYFSIRIMSAPAALAHFAVLGWLIGLHKSKQALLIQLVVNITNILLDVLLVLQMHWGIAGAAYATVIAEYIGLVFGLFLIIYQFKCQPGFSILKIFQFEKLKQLAVINGNIFVRSLCLQIVFLYFTATATDFGDTILAVNALLMNFQLMAAYALDGFANAAEALVGESIGQKSHQAFNQTVKATSLWAAVFAFLFAIIYGLFWQPIVYVMTDVIVVRELSMQYIVWAIILPLVSVASFQLDGIFIGATQTSAMRNSMLVSLGMFVFMVVMFTPTLGNHGLWLAFNLFMVVRAASLLLAWSSVKKQLRV